jgi:hypothetical protein
VDDVELVREVYDASYRRLEPDGTVWRSTDATWRSFARVTGAGRVGGLVPEGAGVLGRAAGATDRLVLVDGAGTARPVPAR